MTHTRPKRFAINWRSVNDDGILRIGYASTSCPVSLAWHLWNVEITTIYQNY
jgi:hypothetical protein